MKNMLDEDERHLCQFIGDLPVLHVFPSLRFCVTNRGTGRKNVEEVGDSYLGGAG